MFTFLVKAYTYRLLLVDVFDRSIFAMVADSVDIQYQESAVVACHCSFFRGLTIRC